MRWTVSVGFCRSAVCAGIGARLGADRHCDDGSKRWWNLRNWGVQWPISVLKGILADVGKYSEFMPYTKESRVLPQDAELCYMVLTPPLVGPLDYTIRVHEKLVKNPNGSTSYHSRWELANTDGPPPRPGITRVTINEGSWLLEPIGNQTRATYTLYTDGGGIPPLVMNFANKQSISRLFDALHARMRDGK
jgi:Polyketide cyclase / dehydrase and lipid transport